MNMIDERKRLIYERRPKTFSLKKNPKRHLISIDQVTLENILSQTWW